MKILNLVQGSDQWKEARKNYLTASEASIMMGCSKNVSRNELLKMKKTSTAQEFSDWFQKNILDKGHEVEKMARHIAEKIIGEELYPVTVVTDDNKMLASLDGSTMLGNIIWECKQWNEEKSAQVQTGKMPDEDLWQVIHQLKVSEAEKCLYMVTDGEKEVHVWIEATEDNFKTLQCGWDQFYRDLESYELQPAKEQAKADIIENLPSLFIDIEGSVKSSNLQTFRDAAISRIESINTDLKSDQDFADAEAMVKFLADKESEVELVKKQALAKTASIDELFSAIDHLKELMRSKRLKLNGLVTERKKYIKMEIALQAKQSIESHISDLNELLGGESRLPNIPFDMNLAMKNKRTISSLQSSADNEAARAKIEATKIFEQIKENLDLIRSAKNQTLFSDKASLSHREKDFVISEMELRQRRFEEEQEKLKKEEVLKLQESAENNAQREKDFVGELVENKSIGASVGIKPSPTKQRKTPSDDEIVNVVANAFGVDFQTAREWILGFEKSTAEVWAVK